jgi:CRISPR system Cascade subunit CasD
VTAFLRFSLYAPLASWGEHAVGEIRGSWDRPSRSAVLGLLAAALGITRDEEARHASLDVSIGIAVRVLADGTTLIDYHTTQNPKENLVKKRRPSTRREALAMAEPETALSRRWLRQDALSVVVLWQRPHPTVTLEQLRTALRDPVFTLYAGRKANAFGLPLAPTLVEAESLGDAVRDIPALPEGFERLRPPGGWGNQVSHDACEGFPSGLAPLQSVVRRDGAPVRSRWHFSNRTLYVGQISSSGRQ